MTLRTPETFVFVGDTEVGQRLSASLVRAGFLAASGLSDADVVLTYHESQTGLEDVYFDTPGLLQDTKEGVFLVDVSPTTPSFAQELHAVGRVNERFVVDAPLVVRDMVAEDAFANPENLLSFVGAEDDVFDCIEPVLSAIAGRVVLMGGPGAGQSAKIAFTLQTASAVIGLVEAQAAGVFAQGGFDAELLIDEALMAGTIAPAHAAFADALRNEAFSSTYTVEMMMAELAAALSAADDKDMIFPQAEAGFHLLELLAVVGGASFNPAALALVFGDEDKSKQFGLDWSRVEGVYHDHECGCGHDHDHDHECECGHHHHDEDEDNFPDGFIGFSAN